MLPSPAGLPPRVPPTVHGTQVVLVGEGGALFEGLQSNFFAVLDGAVHTAGEGVLAGTVREVALAVARREGIPGGRGGWNGGMPLHECWSEALLPAGSVEDGALPV